MEAAVSISNRTEPRVLHVDAHGVDSDGYNKVLLGRGVGLVDKVPNIDSSVCPSYEADTWSLGAEEPAGDVCAFNGRGDEDGLLAVCSPDAEHRVMDSKNNIVIKRRNLEVNCGPIVPDIVPVVN